MIASFQVLIALRFYNLAQNFNVNALRPAERDQGFQQVSGRYIIAQFGGNTIEKLP